MRLKFNIDAEEIAKAFKELELEVQQDLEKGIANLAAMTHAHTVELAQKELKSSRQKYTDNLKYEQLSEGLHVITLLEPALFIEEGLKPNFDMKPGLLKNAKTAADGSRYAVVPFDQSIASSNLTPYAKDVVNRIRKELKKENISLKNIEYNENGSPKQGLLHVKNFGGEIPGKGNTPIMNGVSVYQTVTGKGNVRRDIMTFRTVSSKQGDKWKHPGIEAKKFMDKAFEWAMKEWEDQILPEILKKYEE